GTDTTLISRPLRQLPSPARTSLCLRGEKGITPPGVNENACRSLRAFGNADSANSYASSSVRFRPCRRAAREPTQDEAEDREHERAEDRPQEVVDVQRVGHPRGQREQRPVDHECEEPE